MALLIGRNTRVEVEATTATATVVTAITKASPGVVSSATHGFTNGDSGFFVDGVQGMTELNGQVFRAANIAAGTLELESIDTTAFGTFTSGSIQKILTWSTLGEARSVTSGGVGLNRLDATTLLDSEKQYALGQSDTPEITIEALSNPFAAAAIKLETAARAGTAIVIRLTLSDGSKRLMRGLVSLPSETIPQGDLVTVSFSLTQIKRRLAFAT